MAKPYHYSAGRGWIGGDKRRLYTFIDMRTGRKIVRPGRDAGGIGPAALVRTATRAEAEKYWQQPLHTGWKTLGGSRAPRATCEVRTYAQSDGRTERVTTTAFGSRLHAARAFARKGGSRAVACVDSGGGPRVLEHYVDGRLTGKVRL